MVAPIGPVQVQSLNPANGAASVRGAAEEAEPSGFAGAIGDALAEVGQRESMAKQAAEAAAVGDLQSVSDYMIAATEAQLATEITVVASFGSPATSSPIMRMQV